MNVDPKTVTAWIVIVVVPVTSAALIATLMQFTEPSFLIIQIKNHFAVTVGLPMAALLSAFIVVALKHSSGPMKFEGLGFKFEGSSCEVVHLGDVLSGHLPLHQNPLECWVIKGTSKGFYI